MHPAGERQAGAGAHREILQTGAAVPVEGEDLYDSAGRGCLHDVGDGDGYFSAGTVSWTGIQERDPLSDCGSLRGVLQAGKVSGGCPKVKQGKLFTPKGAEKQPKAPKKTCPKRGPPPPPSPQKARRAPAAGAP